MARGLGHLQLRIVQLLTRDPVAPKTSAAILGHLGASGKPAPALEASVSRALTGLHARGLVRREGSRGIWSVSSAGAVLASGLGTGPPRGGRP